MTIMDSNNDPRIERLKEVLSSSYPRFDQSNQLVPLPQSVLARLHPKAELKKPLLAKLIGSLARPMPALAIVTVCAFLIFRPDPVSPTPDSGLRSGGETASTPELILINASAATLEKFQLSGYFPENLLRNFTSYTPGNTPAIVLNWKTGTMTRYLAGEEPVSRPMTGNDAEVLEQVLEFYQDTLSK